MRTFFTGILWSAFLVAFIPLQVLAGTPQKRILFFSPTTENNTYWPQVYATLNAVAEDLNITIERHEFDVRDRFKKHIKGVRILQQLPKPDAAIFSVAFGNTEPLLKSAEKLDIPVFIQGPIFPSELPRIGNEPRKSYKNWVGYFYQDEIEKGYILGRELIFAAEKANAFSRDGRIHVAGVGGDHSWFGSRLRQEGLIKAVAAHPKAKLLQVIPTLWTQSEGKKKTALILRRYPEVSVVWAASDQLGIGASRAIEESGKILNETCFVGGMDLSRNGLKNLKSGKLAATVASSMISYAAVLIYLHDYIDGIDFKDDVGTQISTKIYTATKDNVDFFLSLPQRYHTVDFKKFSKVYNRDLKHYDFSLKRFAEPAE